QPDRSRFISSCPPHCCLTINPYCYLITLASTTCPSAMFLSPRLSFDIAATQNALPDVSFVPLDDTGQERNTDRLPDVENLEPSTGAADTAVTADPMPDSQLSLPEVVSLPDVSSLSPSTRRSAGRKHPAICSALSKSKSSTDLHTSSATPVGEEHYVTLGLQPAPPGNELAADFKKRVKENEARLVAAIVALKADNKVQADWTRTRHNEILSLSADLGSILNKPSTSLTNLNARIKALEDDLSLIKATPQPAIDHGSLPCPDLETLRTTRIRLKEVVNMQNTTMQQVATLRDDISFIATEASKPITKAVHSPSPIPDVIALPPPNMLGERKRDRSQSPTVERELAVAGSWLLV
ncbi:hypothetical protein B0H34DRAFT_827688, partial [Crassisporium funariophilum]